MPGKNELFSSLERFEASLETPVVPGEMLDWLETAQQLCREVDSLVRREIDEKHPQTLQEISRQDVSLTPRIDELKANDVELLGKWNEMVQKASALYNKADQAEPNEAKIDSPIKRFGDDALKLVIETRKQESALETWYMEAFDRDRGVAD
jgi:hypothetical protein